MTDRGEEDSSLTGLEEEEGSWIRQAGKELPSTEREAEVGGSLTGQGEEPQLTEQGGEEEEEDNLIVPEREQSLTEQEEEEEEEVGSWTVPGEGEEDSWTVPGEEEGSWTVPGEEEGSWTVPGEEDSLIVPE